MVDQPTGQKTMERDDSNLKDRAIDSARHAAEVAGEYGQDAAAHYVRQPARDLFALLRDYSRDKPDVAAVWCFFLGVIVGWKLKP